MIASVSTWAIDLALVIVALGLALGIVIAAIGYTVSRNPQQPKSDAEVDELADRRRTV